MSKDCDERCVKIQNDLKDLLTPIILMTIQKINKQLKKNNEPFLLIVSGGEAIYRFFDTMKSLRSHDFDLKLAPIIGRKYTRTRQHKLCEEIAQTFEDELNEYFEGVRDQLESTFLDNFVLYGGKDLFRAKKHIREGGMKEVSLREKYPLTKTLDLYALLYAVRIGAKLVYKDSMVDIFASVPRNSKNKGEKRVHYYDHINAANKSLPKIYIPYTLIEGVPYASLGYLLWDTLRMIKWAQKVSHPKLERYQLKLEKMVEGLYHPKYTLNCNAMKEFAKGCAQSFKEDCEIKGKRYNKNELIDYAVGRGIIPASLKSRFEKELSKDYLCKYISNVG